MTVFNYKVTSDDVSNNLAVRDIIRKKFNFSTRLRGRLKRENRVMQDGNIPIMWKIPPVGSIISIHMPDEDNNFPPIDIPIEIVFEDDHLLVINKQPNLVSHPSRRNPDKTLANAISHYQNQTGQDFKLRFINRIDTDTSGIIILGKNSHAQDIITKQMKNHMVTKNYLAIVHGILEKKEGTINLPIGKPNADSVKRGVMENGRVSITNYKVIGEYFLNPSNNENNTPKLENENYSKEAYSLLSVNIETGRTHQIRVHFSHIGHPIAGDSMYGGESSIIGRQALHSYETIFLHPVTNLPLELKAPVPQDILDAINGLEKL